MLNIFSAFRYFLLHISSLLFSFCYIANFFPNCHIFIKIFSSSVIKYIHLVLSEYLLYILISGKKIHKSLISLLSL